MAAVRMDLSAGEQSYPASAHVALVAIAAQHVHLRLCSQTHHVSQLPYRCVRLLLESLHIIVAEFTSGSDRACVAIPLAHGQFTAQA
jgi:hypothetical protein